MTLTEELIQARISAIQVFADNWEPSQLDRENATAIAALILDPEIDTVNMHHTHEIFRNFCPEDHTQNVPLMELPDYAIFLERIALRAMLLRVIELCPEDRRYRHMRDAHAAFAVQVAVSTALIGEVLPIGADMMHVQANLARTSLTLAYNVAAEEHGSQYAMRLMDMIRRDALSNVTIPPEIGSNVRTLH